MSGNWRAGNISKRVRESASRYHGVSAYNLGGDRPAWKAKRRTPYALRRARAGLTSHLYVFSIPGSCAATEMVAAAAVNLAAQRLYNTKDEINDLGPSWRSLLDTKMEERIDQKVDAFLLKARLPLASKK